MPMPPPSKKLTENPQAACSASGAAEDFVPATHAAMLAVPIEEPPMPKMPTDHEIMIGKAPSPRQYMQQMCAYTVWKLSKFLFECPTTRLRVPLHKLQTPIAVKDVPLGAPTGFKEP